jgi:thiol-disulfide isomerase/thioredoxin
MLRSGLITIAVLAGICLLMLWYTLRVGEHNRQDKIEQSPAAQALTPDSLYTDINGTPLTFERYLGQPVVAITWASWCPDCQSQLELLQRIALDYPELVVLAFNRGESAQTAQAYLDHFNITTEIQLVLDPTDNFFSSIDGYSMPETIIFNPSGDVVYHARGPITESQLRSRLSALP